MRLLFTKSNKIGSRLICRTLGEPVSHVAIEFSNGIVLHSQFSGVIIESAKKFLREHQVVFELPYHTREDAALKTILDRYYDAAYDFRAFAYFTWRVLLRNLFVIPFSKNNRWQQPDKFLCTGLATYFMLGQSNDMITPYQLYLQLRSQT